MGFKHIQGLGYSFPLAIHRLNLGFLHKTATNLRHTGWNYPSPVIGIMSTEEEQERASAVDALIKKRLLAKGEPRAATDSDIANFKAILAAACAIAKGSEKILGPLLVETKILNATYNTKNILDRRALDLNHPAKDALRWETAINGLHELSQRYNKGFEVLLDEFKKDPAISQQMMSFPLDHILTFISEYHKLYAPYCDKAGTYGSQLLSISRNGDIQRMDASLLNSVAELKALRIRAGEIYELMKPVEKNLIVTGPNDWPMAAATLRVKLDGSEKNTATKGESQWGGYGGR